MISLLEHNAQGATISLGQRELLLVMALIQEGRESFGCNTETGEALDTFFCSANIQVEAARRKDLKNTMMRQKIVTAPNIASRKGASTAETHTVSARQHTALPHIVPCFRPSS